MELKQLKEVLQCLPGDRTKFYYAKGHYALMLLSMLTNTPVKIARLKQSRLAKLVYAGSVKRVIAESGKPYIDREVLDAYWEEELTPFVLTADGWGGGVRSWQQTTRKGYNLVLQLNFSNQHDAQYKSLVKPMANASLNYSGHPIYRGRSTGMLRETLAWARLDFDFKTNEVLIEEIQSDWVREARSLLADAREEQASGETSMSWWGVDGRIENLIYYVEQVLRPYIKLWDEAMLAATLQFVYKELGIDVVYYHSYESGEALKCIAGSAPRSLYTELPRRFCFSQTDESPRFLQADRDFKRRTKKMPAPRWYRLDFKEVGYAC